MKIENSIHKMAPLVSSRNICNVHIKNFGSANKSSQLTFFSTTNAIRGIKTLYVVTSSRIEA